MVKAFGMDVIIIHTVKDKITKVKQMTGMKFTINEQYNLITKSCHSFLFLSSHMVYNLY